MKYEKEIEEFVKGMPDGHRWALALEAALEVADDEPVPSDPMPTIREFARVIQWYQQKFKPYRLELTERIKNNRLTMKDVDEAEALDKELASCGIRLMVTRHQLIKILKLSEDIGFEELSEVIKRVGGIEKEGDK
jgi:hypothetical protein